MSHKNTFAARAALATVLATIAATSLFGDGIVAKASFGSNEIRLYDKPLSYEVVKDGCVVVSRSEIGIELEGGVVALSNAQSTKSDIGTGSIRTPVYKKAEIELLFDRTEVDFGDFAVRLVARADGVAWRFVLNKPRTVIHEKADVTVPDGARCWFNRSPAKWHFGHEETVPEAADAKELPGDRPIYMPFAYTMQGKTVAITDADVYEYPAWYLEAKGDGKLTAAFARYPKAVRNDGAGPDRRGRWLRVSEEEAFVAKDVTTLPWRVFILADEPAKLCEADIVYALSRPAEDGADFSWVKPGKVAWDWWNDFDNKGEEAGCTTEGYMRFIDFAAANGVEYVILDEGWSEKLDIWKFSPRVDVEKVIRYGEERGVGIILWMAWAQAFGEEERVAEHFSRLGAKGFKVDFIDRADAVAASFMEKFASACVKHKMLVDFHGVYRPTGMQRQFPNIVNYEGVHGLEQMKWAKAGKDMCANDVAAFFLRGTAGPMDYTPGAMDNYRIGEYAGTNTDPGSVGTRAHQMALMALYEAPLNMLSDSPTKYEANMECFRFMASVPTVWADTRGLGGDPESFAVVARKAYDGSWWVAGIGNRDARDYILNTRFLGPDVKSSIKSWHVELFSDSKESDETPTSYVHSAYDIVPGSNISLHMASGGGFLMKLTRLEQKDDRKAEVRQ